MVKENSTVACLLRDDKLMWEQQNINDKWL